MKGDQISENDLENLWDQVSEIVGCQSITADGTVEAIRRMWRFYNEHSEQSAQIVATEAKAESARIYAEEVRNWLGKACDAAGLTGYPSLGHDLPEKIKELKAASLDLSVLREATQIKLEQAEAKALDQGARIQFLADLLGNDKYIKEAEALIPNISEIVKENAALKEKIVALDSVAESLENIHDLGLNGWNACGAVPALLIKDQHEKIQKLETELEDARKPATLEIGADPETAEKHEIPAPAARVIIDLQRQIRAAQNERTCLESRSYNAERFRLIAVKREKKTKKKLHKRNKQIADLLLEG